MDGPFTPLSFPLRYNFLFSLTLAQAQYAPVLKNENVLMDKAQMKIEEMSQELYKKTGQAFYLQAIRALPAGDTITSYVQKEAATLTAPYVLLVLSANEKQIEMAISPDLAKVIDKDEILDDYIIPILVAHVKNATDLTQYSAGLLNGSGEVIDRLAAAKGVTLLSSIGSGSKNFFDGLMVVVWIMLILTVGAYVLAKIKQRQGN